MKIFKFIIPIIFLVLGLMLCSYPMLLDFDKMPGALDDARFINYILEHFYLWTQNVEIHKSFWVLPMFYPNTNTLAYSDVLLGSMLIYYPFRFFLNDPQTAFQCYFLAVNILNFVCFYYFSKKIFKLDNFYSSFSAFLFSFCLPRTAHTLHLQLFVQFFMILSIHCFALMNNEKSKIRNKILFTFGVAFFVIQFYTTFYFGWYMVYALPIILFVFLLFKDTRQKLINWFKCLDFKYIFIILAGVISLLPLFYHYLLLNSKFAKAEPTSIFHLFYSYSLLDLKFIDLTYFYFPEAILGIGLFTTFLIISATFKSKYKWPIIIYTAIVMLTFINNTIYSLFYDIYPPAGAIRALGRFVFILIPVFAIVLAYYFKNTKSKVAMIIMMSIVVLEQFPYINQFNWSKTEHRKRLETYQVKNECKVIAKNIEKNPDIYINQMDILWFANNKNMFTTNGYSGFMPQIDNSIVNKECFIERIENGKNN